jgi:hypothetical protein
MNDWTFIATFHNLSVKDRVENLYFMVCPYYDAYVKQLASKSNAFRIFRRRFKDQFRRKVKPSFLFTRLDLPVPLEVLINFRNILAISTIAKAWCETVAYDRQLTTPRYSNYFDIYPLHPSRDGESIVISSPSILGLDSAEDFSGQSSPELAPMSLGSDFFDQALFHSLDSIWIDTNVRNTKVNKWRDEVLFRSLQMAYQACQLPFSNQGTIYDYGTNLLLWISAFETLVHPGPTAVSVLTVLEQLGEIPFQNNKLRRKLYRIEHRGQKISVNLIQKYYYQMYQCRNAFLHGNPVSVRNLFPYSDGNLHSLTNGAPLVYTVLLIHLLIHRRVDHLESLNYEGALLKLYSEPKRPKRRTR